MVWVKYGLVNIQSATWLMNIENSHIARYGKADKNPFWKIEKNIFLESYISNAFYLISSYFNNNYYSVESCA